MISLKDIKELSYQVLEILLKAEELKYFGIEYALEWRDEMLNSLFSKYLKNFKIF